MRTTEFRALLLLAVAACGFAQAASPAFELAPLPYPANALEPVITEATMSLHHGKHHKAYVDALNRAVAADAALAGLSLEQLLATASTRAAVVRNNGGGHWNHAFFWESMTRPDQGGAPSPALRAALERDFGSLEAFRAAFRDAGTGSDNGGCNANAICGNTPGGNTCTCKAGYSGNGVAWSCPASSAAVVVALAIITHPAPGTPSRPASAQM